MLGEIKANQPELEIDECQPKQKKLKKMFPKRNKKSVDELQKYLSLEQEDIDVDPILFWRQNKSKFPNLARVALNVLSIPGGAVACERTFNIGRDIVGIRRHALNEDTLSSLMIGHHRLKKNL